MNTKCYKDRVNNLHLVMLGILPSSFWREFGVRSNITLLFCYHSSYHLLLKNQVIISINSYLII